MIYVLFGPSGVGKTYIGNLVAKKLGWKFFDADVLFDEKLKQLVRDGEMTMESREIFFERLQLVTERILKDLSSNNNLLVAQAFVKERNRVEFYDHFDKQVRYILVHAPKLLAKTRTIERISKVDHTVDSGAFEYVWREFEKPKIVHADIINDTEKDDSSIIECFKQLTRSNL